MQETRNNCFGLKKRSTTLRQAKTGKHECRNITATYAAVILRYISCLVRFCYVAALVLTCFRLTTGRPTFYPPETIVASFLHLMVLFLKVVFKHTSKRQFVVLHCHVTYISFFIHCIFLMNTENT